MPPGSSPLPGDGGGGGWIIFCTVAAVPMKVTNMPIAMQRNTAGRRRGPLPATRHMRPAARRGISQSAVSPSAFVGDAMGSDGRLEW